MEKSNINKHIGNKFQEYRLKNNLTQNQVAELTGLEPRHISQIERGLSKGSIDTLLKLCNAYKITPDIILYDLLDEDLKKDVSIYAENFKKIIFTVYPCTHWTSGVIVTIYFRHHEH